ncbi:MAG: chemotaxis protein CheB [Deltaproteobacteria bacterium]
MTRAAPTAPLHEPHFAIPLSGYLPSGRPLRGRDTGMAFVVISHILPTASSQLAEILARCTKMAVRVALEAMPIRPNHVYVYPPDTDLLIENNAFKVISPRAKRNEQVDLFFGSLAEVGGPRAIGIIMSGYDGDRRRHRGLQEAEGNVGRSRRHADQRSRLRLYRLRSAA